MEHLRENLQKHMEYLCLRLGSKHCGSPELERAGEYIEAYYRSLGLPTRREEFPVRGWTFRGFSLYDMTERREVPAATACFFSNAVYIEDVPLWIGWQDIERLDTLPVRGRLCFVAAWHNLGNVFGYNGVAEKLDAMGAAAAIFISPHQIHTDLAPSTKIERSPFLKQLGACAVAQAGAIYIAGHRNDRYALKIDAECFDTTAFNVIARVGNGPRRAAVGAHYDTTPLVQGAQDNIGGTCVLMELARLLKDEADGWSVDFAAFSAEEYIPKLFPPGSGDYVERHRDENLRWYLNIDDFAGYFHVPVIHASHLDKLPPMRFPYEWEDITESGRYSGDDKAFGYAGIPTVWIAKKNCFFELHTAEDNLTYTDFDRMVEGTAEYMDLYRQLLQA